MTPSQKSHLVWSVSGSILGAVVLALLMGAWSAKESVSAHNVDIQVINGKLQRILDVVCAGKLPTTRACQS